jgi:membrane protein implicated in regulation of membrane protease activity
MWSSIVFGVVLSILALWMMWRSFQDRRERAQLSEEIRDHEYFVQLDGRRKNINVTLLIIGTLVAISPLVSGTVNVVVYWSVVTILACFMGMLALADLQASRDYLDELRAQQLVDYERVRGEVDKFREEIEESEQVDPESNGQGLNREKNDKNNI